MLYTIVLWKPPGKRLFLNKITAALIQISFITIASWYTYLKYSAHFYSFQDEVRTQDTVFVIMSVGLSRSGRELVWQFFKDHWDMLYDRYQGGFLLNHLVKITENFASESMASEIEMFFKDRNSAGIERAIQQSVENVSLNSAWLKRDFHAIKMYLSVLK